MSPCNKPTEIYSIQETDTFSREADAFSKLVCFHSEMGSNTIAEPWFRQEAKTIAKDLSPMKVSQFPIIIIISSNKHFSTHFTQIDLNNYSIIIWVLNLPLSC